MIKLVLSPSCFEKDRHNKAGSHAVSLARDHGKGHSNLKPPAGLACVTFRYASRNSLRLNPKMFLHQRRNLSPDGHNQNPSASQESQNNKSPHHVISAKNPILYAYRIPTPTKESDET